jgi:hypothetical protein
VPSAERILWREHIDTSTLGIRAMNTDLSTGPAAARHDRSDPRQVLARLPDLGDAAKSASRRGATILWRPKRIIRLSLARPEPSPRTLLLGLCVAFVALVLYMATSGGDDSQHPPTGRNRTAGSPGAAPIGTARPEPVPTRRVAIGSGSDSAASETTPPIDRGDFSPIPTWQVFNDNPPAAEELADSQTRRPAPDLPPEMPHAWPGSANRRFGEASAPLDGRTAFLPQTDIGGQNPADEDASPLEVGDRRAAPGGARFDGRIERSLR